MTASARPAIPYRIRIGITGCRSLEDQASIRCGIDEIIATRWQEAHNSVSLKQFRTAKNMGMYIVVIGLFLSLASVSFAKGNCAQNRSGKIVCAPPGGTITTNKNGDVVCGKGNCVVTISGMIYCSTQPGGNAVINGEGKAVCAGLCVSASPNICAGAQ